MKKFLAGLAVLFLAVVTMARPMALVWTYPVYDYYAVPGLGFMFFTSPDLSIPPAQWDVFTNVPAAWFSSPTLDSTGTNAVFTLPFESLPGQHFFWGKPVIEFD